MIKQPVRIFVADDDPDDQYLIKEAFKLSPLSTDIIAVFNGAQLLQILNDCTETDQNPDIIILDLNMPVMDGLTALTRIRKIATWDKTPVYVLSTSKHDSDKSACELMGAKNFYTKPTMFSQLQLVAREILLSEFPDASQQLNKLAS